MRRPRVRPGVLIYALTLLLLGVSMASAEMLRTGDAFPEWQLRDHTGTTVSSRDLAGKKYLLWYYVKALTPG